jgi:hypothetical protein
MDTEIDVSAMSRSKLKEIEKFAALVNSNILLPTNNSRCYTIDIVHGILNTLLQQDTSKTPIS